VKQSLAVVANIANEARAQGCTAFFIPIFASSIEARAVLPLGWNKKRARESTFGSFGNLRSRVGGDDERNSISLMRPAAAA